MKGPVAAIGVIGAGAVGQTVSALLMGTGWCREILIASGSPSSAEALVADLEDMQQVLDASVLARIAHPADMNHCAAVVVCPRAKFTNTATTDVRMAGLAANAPIVASLARTLAGYTGTTIVVTNPVDVMARLFAEVSGCRRVYGVGSNTDTARYRLTLAHHLHVPVDAIDGHVIGEHGDDAVVCAAATRVAGLPVAVPLAEARAELRARPRRINQGIGRARAGPAGAVLAALRATLGLADGVVELCVNHDDRWRGIPLHFTAGQPTVCLPELDLSEAQRLVNADNKLRAAYAALRSHLAEQGEEPQ
ncbi:lactate/malate family dehydrogenase [Streptomyces sp. NRRL B-1347]|uniref:lactate/malate family dehydrogenase n=1 Tax=Streptomyces sp. NRRL B-1347 TaxID=1476877 RepID=UPI0004CB9F0C|nr:lactate dehydrogenase [Streptomyces sp. NRRL B-1347]